MELGSCTNSSKPSSFVENKRKVPESNLNKKVVCTAQKILVDLSGVYFDKEQASRVIASFPESADRRRYFAILHKSGTISSWLLADHKATLKGYYNSRGVPRALEPQKNFIICQYSETIYFLDRETLFFEHSIEATSKVNSFLFDGRDDNYSDLQVDGGRFYMCYGKGKLQRSDFDPDDGLIEVEVFTKTLDEPFYIKSMKMLNNEIIAACNSKEKEKPASCVQWFDADGTLIKSKLESEKTISTFTLVNGSEIFLVYKDKSILKHDLKTDTTISKEPFVKGGTLNFSLFPPYLIAYCPGFQADAFLLDASTLEICYQIDFGTTVNTKESLVSIDGSTDRKEVIVTTTTKVYESDLFFETQPEQDVFESHFKYQKTQLDTN